MLVPVLVPVPVLVLVFLLEHMRAWVHACEFTCVLMHIACPLS